MEKRKFTLIMVSIFTLLFITACGIVSFTPPSLPDLDDLTRLLPQVEVNFATPAPTEAPARVEAQVQAAPTRAPSTQSTQPGLVQPGIIEAYQNTLVDIYDLVNPSVVNIQILQRQNITTHPDVPGFPFYNTPEELIPEDFFSQGVGSGFVWNQEGYIITNNHVIADADRVEVTFSDGTITIAEVVGTDVYSDLAVIKVDLPAEQLRPVQMANSNDVRVGQLAIAIGNPFGLNGTMTVGIISGLERELPASTTTLGGTYNIPDIIQTDAPINPGNSGGVLVNVYGQVIGVTAAIQSPIRANAGVGYAIPAAIVQKVVPSLIESGSYQHPWLGISARSITPDLAQNLGLDTSQRGALIVDVITGSPAERAGLRGSSVGTGDIIVSIDGDPIRSMSDVIAYLARYTEIGQTIEIGVLRNGQIRTIELILGARPPAELPSP
jgi:S1-C subfamily serine protease